VPQVFGLINIIIERLGEDIVPHVQGLLPLLPQIWQGASDQSLLRIQVRTSLLALATKRLRHMCAAAGSAGTARQAPAVLSNKAC
jgi:hypothetical protein